MKKIFISLFTFICFFTLVGCNQEDNIDEEKANEVVNLINELPSTSSLTLEHEELIVSIRAKYEALNVDEKTLVNNYYKLTSAESKIERLKKEYTEELIEEIESLIDELPSIGELSQNDDYLINNISTLIERLGEENINSISNIMKYQIAKDRVEELKLEAIIDSTSKHVINLINNLPEVKNVSLENEEEVIQVRNAYDELLEGAKGRISNYKKLLEIEDVISTLKEFQNFDPRDVLNCISDVATSNTNDLLIVEGENFTVEWSSSNEKLYYFEDGFAKVSKVYQTHRKQNVTVTANITLSNGELITLTKLITVNPVLFTELSDTPVATYFQSSALSSYTNYSDRYLKEGTLFSDKAKDVLDIVYFAFANLDEFGNITLSNYDVINELMPLKGNDVRIVLCIAGVSGSGSKNFATVTADDTKCKNFVNNIMNTVERYNFDGVDIDWESTGTQAVVATSMNKLMRLLREEMNARQDPDGSNYLLSAAVPASSWGTATDRFDFKTLNKYVDYINMMSYDMNKTTHATHLSPLYVSSYDGGYGFGVDYGVKRFTSLGLDKNKIIIGSAGYGKSYKISGNVISSKYPALGYSASLTHLNGVPGAHASGTVFWNAISRLEKAGSYVKYIEYNSKGELVGSYLYNASAGIFVTYDSEEVIKAKYEYACASEGMGIMCWAYTEDTDDNFVDSIYDVKHSK